MIASILRNQHAAGIRRVQLARDLKPIADLIEECFGPRMDPGGRATIREMRALSRMGPLLHLMALADDMLKGIGAGFVWEADGRIIGNVTLFPARQPVEMGRVFVIANVAVAPEYRRRGIARKLMAAAMEAVHEGKGSATILQVESDNDSAIRLYEQLGFRLQRTWHEWRRSGQIPPPHRLMGGPPINHRSSHLWQAEYAMAELAFPPHLGGLGWQRPLHPGEFRQSALSYALDFLSGTATERWTVRQGSTLAGSLWARTRFGVGAVRLTLIVPPQHRGQLEAPLLNYGLQRLAAGYRPLVCEHPTDRTTATAVFEQYQFTCRRTLDHMRIDF
jgi:ribosomal protein S18 acetylase RimI-like enzyme